MILMMLLKTTDRNQHVASFMIVGRLVEIGRQVDKADRAALMSCADYLIKLDRIAYAVDVYKKLGDMALLASLWVKMKQWEEVSSMGTHHIL